MWLGSSKVHTGATTRYYFLLVKFLKYHITLNSDPDPGQYFAENGRSYLKGKSSQNGENRVGLLYGGHSKYCTYAETF